MARPASAPATPPARSKKKKATTGARPKSADATTKKKCDKKTNDTCGGAAHQHPPVLTASFVMGVQRRPLTRQSSTLAQARGKSLYAELLKEAATVEQATAAAAAAEMAAEKAASELRSAALAAAAASSGTQPKYKENATSSIPTRHVVVKKKASTINVALSKACGAVARAAATRTAVATTAEAAAYAKTSKRRLDAYAAAWQSAIDASGVTGVWKTSDGTRKVGERLPVGHKLKVLMRQCGVMLSEEAFTLKFGSELGGTGSMCDYETFMRFVCEHDASDDARSHQQRCAKRERAQKLQQVVDSTRTPSRSSPSRLSSSSSPFSSSIKRRSPLSSMKSANKRWSSAPSKLSTSIEWDEWRQEVCFGSIPQSAEEWVSDESSCAGMISEVAAKALMIKCGASEGSLRIDRKAFLQAAAADDARIAKAKAKKSLEA